MRETARSNYIKAIAHIMIVMMVCTCLLPLQAEVVSAGSGPKAPSLKEVRHNGKSLSISWKKVSGCSGYQIEYAANRVFLKGKSVSIGDADATSTSVSGISPSENYYVRIRAYEKDSDGTEYSAWTISSNARVNKTVSKKRLKKKSKVLELKKAAKQKVPGYDTIQGACYHDGYVYYLLENRNVSYNKGRCKIVKMKLSSRKVVKVSKKLKLSHGNDITYDTKRNRIVVAHSTPVPKKVSTVSPKTLRVTSTKTVKISRNLYKLPHPKSNPDKYYKAYNGFGAIAYNKKHDQYVVLLRGAKFHHLMFLDGALNPVRFQYVDTRANQMVQGIDSTGDFVLVGQSYSSGKPYNNILVYDWDGNYISKLTLGKKYELETVFHTGSTFYAGFYTSYYKVKKKGKKRKYYLQRNNYLYELSKL